MSDSACAIYRDTLKTWLDQVPLRRVALDWLCQKGVVAYLVGGTVRDALVGQPGHDMDLAIDGDALALGRGLADHLGGAFVPLDVEHNVSRVVVRTSQGPQHLDLAGLRGDGILADLEARDLTVNAMAIQVSPAWGALLDPTGGQHDLAGRLLRVTGPQSFVDDPARLLRTVRLRGKLGFEVEATTEAMLSRYAVMLEAISPERVRDELILMLAQDQAAPSLRYALKHDLLAQALPEIARAATPSQDGLTRLERVEQWLVALRSSADERGTHLPAALERHGQHLQSLWTEELCSERSRACLLKLAVLVSATPQPSRAAHDLGRRLRMSSVEVRYLQAASAGLASATAPLSRLDIYRHFRQHGDAGVGAAVVALAAAPDDAPVAAQVEQLLTAWFEQYAELVDPPRWLTGRDVMAQRGLKPGPRVGALLEELRKAQVMGEINSRDEALAWLRRVSAPN